MSSSLCGTSETACRIEVHLETIGSKAKSGHADLQYILHDQFSAGVRQSAPDATLCSETYPYTYEWSLSSADTKLCMKYKQQYRLPGKDWQCSGQYLVVAGKVTTSSFNADRVAAWLTSDSKSAEAEMIAVEADSSWVWGSSFSSKTSGDVAEIKQDTRFGENVFKRGATIHLKHTELARQKFKAHQDEVEKSARDAKEAADKQKRALEQKQLEEQAAATKKLKEVEESAQREQERLGKAHAERMKKFAADEEKKLEGILRQQRKEADEEAKAEQERMRKKHEEQIEEALRKQMEEAENKANRERKQLREEQNERDAHQAREREKLEQQLAKEQREREEEAGRKKKAEDERVQQELQWSKETYEYERLPDWKLLESKGHWNDSRFNVAVVGNQDCGKSSFFNVLMGHRDTADEEATEEVERRMSSHTWWSSTPKLPAPFEAKPGKCTTWKHVFDGVSHRDLDCLVPGLTLWDIPGAEADMDSDTYARTAGLRYFDMMVVATDIELLEPTCQMIIHASLSKPKGPKIVFVRTKMDMLITGNWNNQAFSDCHFWVPDVRNEALSARLKVLHNFDICNERLGNQDPRRKLSTKAVTLFPDSCFFYGGMPWKMSITDNDKRRNRFMNPKVVSITRAFLFNEMQEFRNLATRSVQNAGKVPADVKKSYFDFLQRSTCRNAAVPGMANQTGAMLASFVHMLPFMRAMEETNEADRRDDEQLPMPINIQLEKTEGNLGIKFKAGSRPIIGEDSRHKLKADDLVVSVNAMVVKDKTQCLARLGDGYVSDGVPATVVVIRYPSDEETTYNDDDAEMPTVPYQVKVDDGPRIYAPKDEPHDEEKYDVKLDSGLSCQAKHPTEADELTPRERNVQPIHHECRGQKRPLDPQPDDQAEDPDAVPQPPPQRMKQASDADERYEQIHTDSTVVSKSSHDIQIAAAELAAAVKEVLLSYTGRIVNFDAFVQNGELATLHFSWGFESHTQKKTFFHYDEKSTNVFCSCILRKQEEETKVKGFLVNSLQHTLSVSLHFFTIKPCSDSPAAKLRCSQLMQAVGNSAVEAFMSEMGIPS